MSMEEKRYAPCPECGGLNGGHSSYKCPKMTLEEAQNKIIEVEQRWIKVSSRMAAGNQKSFSRLKTAIVFYQGKYTLLKEENNKLRQYATKLHQANETIKILTYDNNRLKGQVERLTNAVEELRTKYDNILATESGHESKTENVWQSGYAAGHEAGCERGKREAQPCAVWVKANITKVLEWAEKFYSENADQLMLDDNVWYISELEEDSEDVRNCREVTAEELADLYLMHHPDESAAGREEDKAHFDNWHRWLSDNGYTYDGEYYYDEDNNYFTPDQLWVKFK